MTEEPFRSPVPAYRLAGVQGDVYEWVRGVWADDPAYQRGEAGPRPDQDTPENYPHGEGEEGSCRS